MLRPVIVLPVIMFQLLEPDTLYSIVLSTPLIFPSSAVAEQSVFVSPVGCAACVTGRVCVAEVTVVVPFPLVRTCTPLATVTPVISIVVSVTAVQIAPPSTLYDISVVTFASVPPLSLVAVKPAFGTGAGAVS